MADMLQPNDSYLADMFSIWEDTLQCAICIGPFKQPVALNCLHSFCKECVELMMRTLNTRKIACPTCRKTTYIYNKSQGADCLARNWYIEDIYDKIRKTQAYLTNRQGEPVSAIDSGVGSDRFAVCTDHSRGVAPYGTTCTQCVLELSTYLQAASKHVLIYDSTRKRYVPLVPYIASTTPSILRMTAMTRRMCNEVLTPKMVMLTPLDDRRERRCHSRARKQKVASPLAARITDNVSFTIRPSSLGTGGVELTRAEATSSPENVSRSEKRDLMRRNEFQQMLSAVLAEEATINETNSSVQEDSHSTNDQQHDGNHLSPVEAEQPATFQQAECVQSEMNVRRCQSPPPAPLDCRPKCNWRPPHGRQISPPLRRMTDCGGLMSAFGERCVVTPSVAVPPRSRTSSRMGVTASAATTTLANEPTAASGAVRRNANGTPRHEFRPARTREETLEDILSLMNDATPLENADLPASSHTQTQEPSEELQRSDPSDERSEDSTGHQSSHSDHSVVTDESQQTSARQLEPDSGSFEADSTQTEAAGASGDSQTTAAPRERSRDKHQWVWRLFGLGDKSSK